MDLSISLLIAVSRPFQSQLLAPPTLSTVTRLPLLTHFKYSGDTVKINSFLISSIRPPGTVLQSIFSDSTGQFLLTDFATVEVTVPGAKMKVSLMEIAKNSARELIDLSVFNSHACGWSMWRLFSLNFPYSDLFLKF